MATKRVLQERTIKRVFDVSFALLASTVAMPVSGLCLIVIKVVSPEAPALFRQERVGYRGEPFIMLKIRTMTDERDEDGNLLPDEERLKSWGRVIRKLSIDELPQIVHILKGQMSWIGPRPLLAEEMNVMTKEEQELRQSMLPGITGWEAVNEDKSDSRRRMAEFDLEYVRNWSLRLDAKIFFLTVAKLFRADRSDEAHRAPKLNKQEYV